MYLQLPPPPLLMMMDKIQSERIGARLGGRQSASGAGAGRGSMRTARHTSRLPLPSGRPTNPSSPPEGLAPTGPTGVQSSEPAAGGVRRMRWTSLMNENVMRAYFRATGRETGRTGYRAVMYPEFLLVDPNLTFTEQNLADRARYIQRSNIFNATELERLRL
ncbi:jg648 [Pararge aegeria aegeria]|uniref:Jg648 protein n=1 Tax=Pararge aegeria aegeria TaxID=348720 RepID=A0A8S4QLR3_9NEOP|nr:jg648 [Pararge aegeria aegeria]